MPRTNEVTTVFKPIQAGSTEKVFPSIVRTFPFAVMSISKKRKEAAAHSLNFNRIGKLQMKTITLTTGEITINKSTGKLLIFPLPFSSMYKNKNTAEK